MKHVVRIMAVICMMAMSTIMSAEKEQKGFGDKEEKLRVALSDKDAKKDEDIWSLRSIEDIPEFCTRVSGMLIQKAIDKTEPMVSPAPSVEASTALAPKIASLFVCPKAKLLCDMYEIVNDAAKDKLKVRANWGYEEDGERTYWLEFNVPARPILAAWQQKLPLKLAKLCASYKQVISMLAEGWHQTNSNELQPKCGSHNAESWYLFTKRISAFTREASLMCNFAEYCRLTSLFDVKHDQFGEPRLYLWICKDTYSQAIKFLHPISLPLKAPAEGAAQESADGDQ